MGSTYLKIMFRYTFILIFAMLLKVAIIDVSDLENEKTYIINTAEPFVLKYNEVDVIRQDATFKKPLFNNSTLNNYVDCYINTNSCTFLEYNLFKIDENTMSVFLNCGSPNNIIYNYIERKNMTFDSLVNNKSIFREKEIDLLKLKYPKFVVEDINFESASYNIYENEIIGYYNTNSYGNLTIKINNNEINDMMVYKMQYDEFYENEIYSIDPNKKTIAFTFDDGPSNYDLELTQFLIDNHQTATFFVVGNRLRNFPKVIEKLVNSKMELGNHTYSHKELTSLNNAQIKDQITKTNDLIYSMAGKKMTLFRAPYGSINNRVVSQTNMSSILWNLDTLDWKYRNADKVYETIINNIEDGDIVLMHSLYQSTVDAVKRAIPELYKNGYQIVSVSELAELKGISLSIGSTYRMLK